MTYSSPKGTISFDDMRARATTSIGSLFQVVKVFTFFGAEDSEASDAFLFLAAALSAAFVFFASDAEGRRVLFICEDCAGGEDERGIDSSGTTVLVALAGSVSSGAAADASAGLGSSSGATLVVALVVSSGAGISSSALDFQFHQ